MESPEIRLALLRLRQFLKEIAGLLEAVGGDIEIGQQQTALIDDGGIRILEQDHADLLAKLVLVLVIEQFGQRDQLAAVDLGPFGLGSPLKQLGEDGDRLVMPFQLQNAGAQIVFGQHGDTALRLLVKGEPERLFRLGVFLLAEIEPADEPVELGLSLDVPLQHEAGDHLLGLLVLALGGIKLAERHGGERNGVDIIRELDEDLLEILLGLGQILAFLRHHPGLEQAFGTVFDGKVGGQAAIDLGPLEELAEVVISLDQQLADILAQFVGHLLGGQRLLKIGGGLGPLLLRHQGMAGIIDDFGDLLGGIRMLLDERIGQGDRRLVLPHHGLAGDLLDLGKHPEIRTDLEIAGNRVKLQQGLRIAIDPDQRVTIIEIQIGVLGVLVFFLPFPGQLDRADTVVVTDIGDHALPAGQAREIAIRVIDQQPLEVADGPLEVARIAGDAAQTVERLLAQGDRHQLRLGLGETPVAFGGLDRVAAELILAAEIQDRIRPQRPLGLVGGKFLGGQGMEKPDGLRHTVHGSHQGGPHVDGLLADLLVAAERQLAKNRIGLFLLALFRQQLALPQHQTGGQIVILPLRIELVHGAVGGAPLALPPVAINQVESRLGSQLVIRIGIQEFLQRLLGQIEITAIQQTLAKAEKLLRGGLRVDRRVGRCRSGRLGGARRQPRRNCNQDHQDCLHGKKLPQML